MISFSPDISESNKIQRNIWHPNANDNEDKKVLRENSRTKIFAEISELMSLIDFLKISKSDNGYTPHNSTAVYRILFEVNSSLLNHIDDISNYGSQLHL
jgi:hypothetical protein